MDLLPYFQTLETAGLGRIVRESVWLFPAIEAVHLLALSLLGGALLLVDLRLLGAGLTGAPAAALARAARPWLTAAVILIIGTGVPLFLSEAVKCYYSPSFWLKMLTLPLALLFTYGVRQRVAERDSTSRGAAAAVGATSITLWFVVAAAGRWIGFS
ncbi:MAG: DUF6644 family protein [Vicinamibacterales bacterium]